MKHTPGPWHWLNPETDKPYDFNVPGYASLRTVRRYGEDKTETIDGKTYRYFAVSAFILNAEDGVNESDGRLIAAAPDLLEALMRLRDAYVTSTSPAIRQNCWEQAHRAIAKAEGKS